MENENDNCFLKPGDKLFVFDEPAVYGNKNSLPRWIEFAAAYKSAADRLTDLIIEEPRREVASLYPIIYLYRHFAEMELKSLLFITLLGTGDHDLMKRAERVLNMHDPNALFDEIVRSGFLPEGSQVFFRPDRDETLYNALLSIRPFLDELSSYDPRSTTFRYPITKQLKPAQVDLHGLSLKNLRQVVEKFAQTCCATRRVMESYVDASINFDQTEMMSSDVLEEGLHVIDSNGTEIGMYPVEQDDDLFD